MNKSSKLIRSYQQKIEAPIGEVFVLLCPVREKEWLSGWDYKMIFTEGGYAEKGCVFETNNDYGRFNWIITRHDVKSYEIQFVKTTDSTVVIIDIDLEEASKTVTHCNIQYTFIALKNEAIEDMHRENTEEDFCKHMKIWEESLNYYLKNGAKLIL